MSEIVFKQHWYLWSTFQDALFSPQESPKFPDFKNSKIWQIWHRYFRFDDKSVLIEIKVVRNDILNNLYLNDKLPVLHSFHSGRLQSWPNSQIWWIFKSDTVISNDTVQCFGRNECQKCYLQQLWIPWLTPEDAQFSY